MTNTFPERKAELDAYEDDIIDISFFHGDKFYIYHKMFSAKAATLLREYKIKVDWSIRDRDILSTITSGGNINVCKLCNMYDHTTPFCHLQVSGKQQPQTSDSISTLGDRTTDRYGRSRVYHDGIEICNNFNGYKGCTRNNCNFAHVCSKCRLSGHSQHSCHKINQNSSNKPSTSRPTEKQNKNK